jgi:hypothetical protein
MRRKIIIGSKEIKKQRMNEGKKGKIPTASFHTIKPQI